MTLLVGLTGGIASGKSYIAAAFAALGTPTLDADMVAREVVTPPSPLLTRIAERFGAAVLTPKGALNRSRLREIVFNDPVARRDLEALTHPAIRLRIHDWIAARQEPYALLVNAIMVETGMNQLTDRMLLVDVPTEVQRLRLIERDGMTPEAAQRMITAQASREHRLRVADDVIDNSAAADPEAAVLRLHGLYLELATGRRQA